MLAGERSCSTRSSSCRSSGGESTAVDLRMRGAEAATTGPRAGGGGVQQVLARGSRSEVATRAARSVHVNSK